MFEFEPKKSIREFDAKKFISKFAEITCKHLSKDKKSQYIDVSVGDFKMYDWVSVLAESEVKLKKKIIDAYLIEPSNGGRRDFTHYLTYSDFFNEERKIEVLKALQGGIFYKIQSHGDVDRANLVLQFKDFKVEHSFYECKAPEEWYSELHANKFKFGNGFFDSADKAIQYFSNKACDDLFGERYFPVVAFPKDTEAEVRSIVNLAKSCSKAIVTDKYIVFGTRCKSYQYAEVINETYKNSGKVAKELQWDWQ